MTRDPTEFDAWLGDRFREGGAFTVLIVLVAIGGARVDLLRTTHLHVIGDEIGWDEVVRLFESAGVVWSGAAFFVAAGPEGLVPDATAKARLAGLVRKLGEDRLLLNEAAFFDRLGRRLRIDEVTRH